MSARRLRIVDALLLKAGWLACVVGAAYDRFWLGPAVVATALAAHLLLTPRPGRDLGTLALVTALGATADGLQAAAGVLAFPGDPPRLGALPLWLLALWPLFGSTFHTTFAALRHRPWLAAALGAAGGPPGYLAADRLGALALPQPTLTSVLALSAAWAVVLPAGFVGSRRASRRPERPPSQ